MNSGAEHPIEPTQSRITKQVLDEINKALIGLRFGQVTVTVQDGNVVQIERIDRRRSPFDKTAP